MTLLDWIQRSDALACAVKNPKQGSIPGTLAYVVRASSGAEHFFVKVDCWYRLSYETVSTLLDAYGGQTPVETV